jgi:hypothetical protein
MRSVARSSPFQRSLNVTVGQILEIAAVHPLAADYVLAS